MRNRFFNKVKIFIRNKSIGILILLLAILYLALAIIFILKGFWNKQHCKFLISFLSFIGLVCFFITPFFFNTKWILIIDRVFKKRKIKYK
jgi:glucan phosphoethanolaminetransferase (alkaline phosphatase superfamily)